MAEQIESSEGAMVPNRFEKLAKDLEAFSAKEVDITQEQAKMTLALLCGLIAVVGYAATQGGGMPIAIDGDVWGYISKNPGSIKDFLQSPNGQQIIKNINESGGGNELVADMAEFRRLHDLRIALDIIIPAGSALLTLVSVTKEDRSQKLQYSTTVIPALAKLVRAMGKQ